MKEENKNKAKKAAKILGSATWSGVKGFAKLSKSIGQSMVAQNTGDRIGEDYYERESLKANNDFRNALNKLKSLKDIGNDNPIPEDTVETDEQFYAEHYDAALDDITSAEAHFTYFNEPQDRPDLPDDMN